MNRKRIVNTKKSKDFEVVIERDEVKNHQVVKDQEFVYEDYFEDGKVLKRMVLIEKDPRDNFRHFTVSDFSMENILASGNEDALRYCSYSDTDVDKVIDVFDRMNKAFDNNNIQKIEE